MSIVWRAAATALAAVASCHLAIAQDVVAPQAPQPVVYLHLSDGAGYETFSDAEPAAALDLASETQDEAASGDNETIESPSDVVAEYEPSDQQEPLLDTVSLRELDAEPIGLGTQPRSQPIAERFTDTEFAAATTGQLQDQVDLLDRESISLTSNHYELDGTYPMDAVDPQPLVACDACVGGMPCGSLNCPSCCGVGRHSTFFYGELLYLRARNAELAYAVPADGPLVAGQPAPIQVGALGILDPDYDLGFRGGLRVALDTVSSLDVRYTLFESTTHDQIVANNPNILRSLVTHPSTATAAEDALAGSGSLEIDFDTVDISYRHLMNCGNIAVVNYVLGARYAQLEQQFAAEFVKLGTEFVSTDIDFDGGGMLLGLEAARYSCRNQLHVYANGYASFLAGRFRGSYFQGDSFDPEVVDVEWEAGRIMPILDLECGIGWTSTDGRLRFSTGYLVSAWFNAVTTQDLIRAVQRNDYLGLEETMTFDGLQARLEYRF